MCFLLFAALDFCIRGEPLMIRNQNLQTRIAFVRCALFSLALSCLAVSRAEATQIYVGASAVTADGTVANWIGIETIDPVTGAWSIPKGITLQNNGVVVGQIQNLSGTVDADPSASVSFGVLAGNTTTAFTIVSSVVSFAALTDPVGTAGASVTVSDFNASGSANLSGQFAGPFSFRALYNGSSVFASLDGPAVVNPLTPGGTTTVSANVPSTTIPGSVSSIQSVFSFTLSANDLGSGTGIFTVTPAPPVPEPGTFGLLALGSAVLLGVARRRSKSRSSR
jgi:hypothetical protein